MPRILQQQKYAAPTKEEVRQWLKELIASRAAPPTAEEIRARLWKSPVPRKTQGKQS